jgi:hypothetical protein
MTAPAQEKTRRGWAGSMWRQMAREIARQFYRRLPWLAIGVCWGVAIGLEVVR